MTPELPPSLPAAVRAALDTLRLRLQEAAGTNLMGLVLYGGLARGRYRVGRSDVNVLVLLRDVSPAALEAIAPALRDARRSVGVEPMILGLDELSRTAEVFPTKFLDIRDHHLVLAGQDPLASLSISRENVRLRIRQELRNQLLRLRRAYVAAAGDEHHLRRALAEVARPVALELAALLALTGEPELEDDRSALVFAAAAKRFGLDVTALERLARLRQDPANEHAPAELCRQVMAVLDRAVVSADQA